ncbi:Threonine/homoserine/homoserine lactone efflux protein [Maribacter sedimenticola]|uniref:Threonine/homoserine/homoserine lactone efflux protein n=1 Tax=Maribacter sedimenticola TaxID=228956 RepID=A0ABY1SJ45_9FLAO|nr:LysE family transporter [Maribacter sedimenticola]SNR61008.1 Threonine/homoserine/homoserine lactone efflux protein [Maribacter sedimenticola]
MLEDIQAAIPLGFFLSFMVGPVFFVLLQTSAVKGFRAAITFDLGVLLADVLFIILAYFSSFQLLENLSNQPGLYVFGGVILLIYGVFTFFKVGNITLPDESKRIRKSDFLGLFIKGFLLNFINIGVLVFWLGIIIIVGPNLDNQPNRFITFFATVLLSYFVTDIFKILLAKQLKRKLTVNRIKWIKKIIGIILIICGIVLIVKGFLPKNQFDIEKRLENLEYSIVE